MKSEPSTHYGIIYVCILGIFAIVAFSMKSLDNAKLQIRISDMESTLVSAQSDLAKVPTVSEVQTKLKKLGYYNGEVDGIVGPLMKDAWRRAVNDQYAAPFFDNDPNDGSILR